MNPMTLEELLHSEDDKVLLGIYGELKSCVVPADGRAKSYMRYVNEMIDNGKLKINPTSYRKVYLPSFSRAILREMADRYYIMEVQKHA